MAIRIPQNKIQYKYTSDNSLVIESTNAFYKGYYYELNNTLYAGKEFSTNAPKLILAKDRNILLTNPATTVYGVISGVKIENTEVKQYNDQIKVEQNDIVTQYFVRNITQTNPIIIKQVDSATFNKLKSNPLYQRTTINCYTGADIPYLVEDLERAEKELPYIKTFLLSF